MMGPTHGRIATLAGLATIPVLRTYAPQYAPHGLAAMIVAVVACAGAGLLPDIDHPDGTIAHSLGAPTEAITRVMSRLFGHRGGTHSLLFAAGTGALSAAATTVTGHLAVLPWLLICVLAGFAAGTLDYTVHKERRRARGHHRHPWWMQAPRWAAYSLAAPFTVAAYAAGVHPGTWLGVFVGVGVLAHLAADLPTGNGCPLFWPARARVDLGNIDTDGWFEIKVLAPTAAGLVVLMVAGDVIGWTTILDDLLAAYARFAN